MNRSVIEKNLFIQNLYNYMSDKGLSQEKLAADLGVAQSTVSAWLSGQNFPRAKTLEKIASYFGTSVFFLLRDNSDTANRPTLTSKEDKLFVFFRQLNATGQDMAIDHTRYLAQNPEYLKETEEHEQ